jgi:SAM-dependent methyltransferase
MNEAEKRYVRTHFTFRGKDYAYFANIYNNTRHNERAIEIPIMKALLDEYSGKRILEVGTVMINYQPTAYDVVDKYDRAMGIIRKDIVEYFPLVKYDLAISISTFEHIGYDESEGKITFVPGKVMKAVKHVQSLLAPNGLFVYSVPLGHAPELDQQLKDHALPGEYFLMKRDEYNGWDETPLDSVWDTDYRPESAFVGALAPVYNEAGRLPGMNVALQFSTHVVFGFVHANS